ncbi:MAG: putative DNA-binding domain-containing protein [Rhizobacter sp.]|nr:putative DNA-binding domain-containing protein [Rhizobacter sp.]
MTRQREFDRQQALLAALLQGDEGTALQPLAAPRPAGMARGLAAYRANLGASAERALAATFPTVQALVGDESFAALARALWHAQPPQRGDLAWFGETLPAFIAASDQLADVPYLADAARLDWLLAAAERAADGDTDLGTLASLAEHDPARLHIVLRPGVAVLSSAYPVVSLWRAHQADGMAHHEAARAALAAGAGEHAVVWRSGWRGQALAIEAPAARWTDSLLRGRTLGAALAQAGEGFVFEDWLVQALQQQWLAKVAVAGA